MVEQVTIGDATLYLGDCREVLPTLGKVDVVVTSPPYGQQRDYGGIGDWSLLVPVAMPLVPWHEKTQFLVNLGLIYRDGECVEYWQDLIAEMRNHSFRLFGWYVWDKGFAPPGGDLNRLSLSHEWVFHFNRASVRPVKWVPTQQRKASGTGLRQVDGSLNGITSPEKCGQQFKIPDSVIRMPPHQARGGIENEHPAIYPVALPSHLIKTFSDDCQTILDPFMGSGTTGVACAKLGRKFIGIEIEPKYFDIACKRIQAAVNEPRLPGLDQPKPTQEAMQL